MPRFIITISFISVLMGCATTSHKDARTEKRQDPPFPLFVQKWKDASTKDLETLQVGANEDDIMWWKTYTLGLQKKTSAPKEACADFKILSEAMEFPLHDLALLRAYEVCPTKEKLAALPGTPNSWYRDLAADIKLKEALATPDQHDDFDAYMEKARLENNKKNKEDFLQKALAIAQKLNLPTETADAQSALYKNSPRLNPAPPFKELSNVALDYRFHREFDKALETYQKILASKEATTEDHFQSLKSIRQTYKVAQKRNEYINATTDLVNWTKKQFKANKKDRRSVARFHDAEVLLARTLWTEDQYSAAMKALLETQHLLKGYYPLDEVYFIQGRMEEERGHNDKALELMEASYKQPISQSGLRDKIAWLKSWNYYKQEKWPEAKASFEQMRDGVKDPADKAKARFWLARSLDQLDLEKESQAELETLIKEDPLGYYGVLAYRELDKPIPPLKANPEEAAQLSLLSVSDLDSNLRRSIEWLIAVDEKSFAEKALNQASDDLKKHNVTSEKTWLTMSSAYARAGLYLPLFSTIGSLQPDVKDKLLNDHTDLLFPQPFGDIIARASKKSGVPQEFIYSIIRQESAFNPEARSSVDAFGLMQLLPSVAKQLALTNNLKYSEAMDLIDPEINIPLGAFELKALMKKYNNRFILAVSGYNANDNAIRGWIKTRYRDDAVEFIEEVPYEETRTYIKLTMRNFIFYRRLLKKDQAISFPEELLAFKE